MCKCQVLYMPTQVRASPFTARAAYAPCLADASADGGSAARLSAPLSCKTSCTRPAKEEQGRKKSEGIIVAKRQDRRTGRGRRIVTRRRARAHTHARTHASAHTHIRRRRRRRRSTKKKERRRRKKEPKRKRKKEGEEDRGRGIRNLRGRCLFAELI